jgi:hypothetical protein
MSDLANVQPGKLTLSMAHYRDVLKTPLRLLPESVQPAALRLWACHKHLAGLETPLPLAGMISVWITEHNLRDDDAAEILNELMAPDRMQGFKFASELTTTLAALVNSRIRARRAEAENLERERERASIIPATPEEMAAFRAQLRAEEPKQNNTDGSHDRNKEFLRQYRGTP